MLERFYCSLASTARGESLNGTALTATTFLLVQHNGPWAVAASKTLDDGSAAAAAFANEVARLGCRLQLIRPHRSTPRRVDDSGMVVYFADGRMWRTTWQNLDDLVSAVSKLATGEPGQQVVSDDTQWTPFTDDLILVCAHAKRDVCCAVQGRKVTSGLAEKWPNQVFETTHLGGDRFAGNVLLLPSMMMLGRLTPDIAVDHIQLHQSGRFHAETSRGICGLAPPVQRSIVHVLAQDHSKTLADVVVQAVETVDVNPEEVSPIASPPGDAEPAAHQQLQSSISLRHQVTLSVAGHIHQVHIAEGKAAPAQNTCTAEKLSQTRQMIVEGWQQPAVPTQRS